ncbi:PfkB family carbohydrate kinase [candidate division CSSED10-310 bacterium]|uniref:PfkB family carbohydrate kinase n=1 Tax=candidate division CSSED10-310 bacterium TaxID=2855610 RepID=A0ABV6Z2W5_UNCC1
MTLLVVGSVALDTVTNQYGKIEDGLGGSAVYFSLAANPFCAVKMVAAVGTDFPQDHIDLLKRKNIDLDGLMTAPGRTFRWMGEYSPDLNNAKTLDTQLNVFEHFKPVLPAEYKVVQSLFLANIDPVLQLNVLSQIENKAIVACDTMNYWITQQKDDVMKVLQKVNLLFINEEEAKMLSETKHITDCARFILEHGPETVIIKRGASGVAVFQEHNVFVAPAHCVATPVDTTGAGDSFAGGFMGFLTRAGDTSWATVKRAAVVGTIIASFNIESFSIHRLNLLKTSEIQQRWQTFSHMTEFQAEPALF